MDEVSCVAVEQVALGGSEIVDDDDILVDGFRDEVGDLRS